MGDDAEYQMELDAEAVAAKRLAEQSAGSSSSRPLFVLVDGEFEEIWDWSSPGRSPGVFAALYESGVGQECFQTDDLPDEAPDSAFIDPDYVVEDGEFEVLIVSPRDTQGIRQHASELSSEGHPLRDSFLAGMFNAMATHIDENPGASSYVFARTI